MLLFLNTSLNDTFVPAPPNVEETSSMVVKLPKQNWHYFLVLPGLGLLILVGWLISAIVYQFTGWQKFEEQRSLFSKGLLLGAGLMLFGLGPNLIRRLPYWRSRLQYYRLQSYRKRLRWIYQFTGQFLPPKYRLNPDQVFANVTPTWGLTLIIYSLNDFHNLLWLEEARRKAEASGDMSEITNVASTEISLEQEARLWGKCLSQTPSAEWVSKLSEYSLPVAAVPPLEVTNLELMARYYLKLARLIRKELAQAGVSIPQSFSEVQPGSPAKLSQSFTEIQPDNLVELPKSFTEIAPVEFSKSLNNGVQVSDFLEQLENLGEIQVGTSVEGMESLDEVQADISPEQLESFTELQASELFDLSKAFSEVQASDMFDLSKTFNEAQATNLFNQTIPGLIEFRLLEDEEIKLL